ncbi:MAG TPA: hypothetical protein VHY20_06445, partial [Pirellulales bacterium]|nr:hypothetical protein [Pirellulales bacterium]
MYEYATGGGLAGEANPRRSPLFAEGSAMLRALAADVAACADRQPWVLWDERLPAELAGCKLVPLSDRHDPIQMLASQAAAADWTIVIAPETGGALEAAARAVLAAGG